MRAGSCGLQQQQAALTPEVAAMVKQAVILAKRRGHAQVTPLHVANSLLSEPNGLLRAACLKSRSHPLLCKALELCFNVALNRLPASSSSSMLSPRHPSTSNALVAVFKRAQAHQRRGSIETQQQQTILAAKIELAQLVISILDDPSVSRVMKEAGFSSTQVKSIVEKDASSLEICPLNSLNRNINPNNKPKELNRSLTAESLRIAGEPVNNVRKEDVNVIIESLLANGRRTKSLVIVGECISNMENTVRALMDRVDIGEVPEELKEVKFVSIPPLYSFCNLQREEVEKKMTELTRLVRSLLSKGVVLYLGDLKWISDYSTVNKSEQQERGCYCSVEHVIMELGRLVWGINNGEIKKFWLMGIATFNTYMRCRSGCNNSLETVWGLHPVIIPANSLGLSLISDQSDEVQLQYRRVEINKSTDQMRLLRKNGSVAHIKPSCTKDYAEKFEAEADQNRRASSGDVNEPEPEPSLSILPDWLKDESRRISDDHHQKYDRCSLAHKKQQATPPSSSSLEEETLMWPCNDISTKPNEDSRHIFSCNHSSSPHNFASSSDLMDFEYTQKLKDFNTENLNHLCNALEKRVPSHKNVIPEIIGTILQCRSGLLTRDEQETKGDAKEDTWLLFIGRDIQAKENISRELAKLLFGSDSNFVSIGPNKYNSFDNASTEVISFNESQNRDDHRSPFNVADRFFHAVKANPHSVFFVEDLKDADYTSRMGLKRAIKSGRICNANGDKQVSLCDAIVVLSCERLRSNSRRCPDPRYGKDTNVIKSNASFDLNVLASDDDDDHEDCYDDDDMGILESVDRMVVFEIKDL